MRSVSAFNSLLLFGICSILTSCNSSAADSPQQVYVSHSIGDNKAIEFARNANYEIAKNIAPDRTLNVDIMSGDRVKNIYSTHADRGKIQHLDNLLQQVETSNDRAFIASIKRIQELDKNARPLTVYILYSGTSDRNTLTEIQQIAAEIAKSGNKRLKIYLLGLSPANKIPTVIAFNPISEQMGGSCIDDYSQCRGFIDALSK